MTKRSFTGIMKYYLSRMKSVWLMLPAYAIVSVIISAILVSAMNTAGLEENLMEYVGVNGFDAFAMLITLLYGLFYAFDFYNTAAGCGVSRRTSVIAQTLVWGITSAVMSAEGMLISVFF